MKIHYMIGFFSFFTTCLVHECQAGLFNSKEQSPGIDVKDERATSAQRKPLSDTNNAPENKSTGTEIIVYENIPFHKISVPVPEKTKILKIDNTGTSFDLKHCTLVLMNSDQKALNKEATELEQKTQLSEVAVKDWFDKIYQDLDYIGNTINQKQSTDRTIESLKKIQTQLSLSELKTMDQTAKFLRNRQSLETTALFNMKENGFIMFTVHPLPNDKWKQ